VDERRSSTRKPVHLAAELDGGGGTEATIAITRDVGAGGLLVLTRAAVEVGRTVKLKVSLGERGVRSLEGKVVREEQLSPEDSSLYRMKVAIACDPNDPVLAEICAALATMA
jgi:hypothetical protein